MIRRTFRFGLLLGLLVGAAFALAKVFGARPAGPDSSIGLPTEPWPRLAAEPTSPAAPTKSPTKKAPAEKAAATKKAAVKAWVEPARGVCPTSHPVKAKLASKIFHLPGMLHYERTNPDRCYVDAAKAEADGLRAAKR